MIFAPMPGVNIGYVEAGDSAQVALNLIFILL